MLSRLIPLEVSELITDLERAGHRAYLVGGCVRDYLMGLKPQDYDITSSATPKQVMSIFAHLKVLPTGIRHGTVTVINRGVSVEITALRKEGTYKDHRHPDKVIYTNSAAEDAARRDFTVNAMYYSPSEGMLDFYGGQADLAAGILRAVGDPELRFEEDALRILRALRFAARLGFTVEKNTVAAMRAKVHLLQHIAAERVLSELGQILMGDYAEAVLTEHSYVTECLFGAKAPDDLGKYPKEYRLPLFIAHCGRNAEGAETLCRSLKTDRRLARSVSAAAFALYGYGFDCWLEVAVYAGKHGIKDARMTCILLERRGGRLPADWESGLALMECGKLPLTLRELAVDGADLKALGVVNGKQMGTLLEKLFAYVHTGGINEKTSLCAEALRIISSEGC